MREYKRLTKRKNERIYSRCEDCSYHKDNCCTFSEKQYYRFGDLGERDCLYALIERLAELEDKIENGTLIELQDKEENLIGQQVYAIDICSYPEGEIVTNFEEDEDEIIIGFTSNEIVTVNTTRGCNSYHKNGLWFLTKAEAEEKLLKLKESENE